MRRPSKSTPYGLWAPAIVLLAGCAAPAPTVSAGDDAAALRATAATATDPQVLLGRALVINHDCGGCHGGFSGPELDGWMAGNADVDEPTAILGEFRVWARNLTPDEETGLGAISERQIFNALRFGLRPSATPDVEITSAVPGEGNHPANPNYLAPAMPWLFWRYMSDDELWAVAAYLKRGLAPVAKQIPESESPPDFWAGGFTVEKVGTHVLPPFPTEHEELRAPDRRDQIVRGRALVAQFACTGCHGGNIDAIDPARDGWLTGMTSEEQEFQIGPFKTRPRNLTPDNTTGLGRFSERQIFNALRFGLRPGETPDVEITSTTPGVGNHPVSPKYLAPPMPWTAWRHIPDEDLLAIAAYLKNGLRPVTNRVADSEGPPDFWVSEYTPEKYGAYPAAPFPTANERRPE